MDLESVKRYLEKGREEGDKHGSVIGGLPSRFLERFTMLGLEVDLIEPDRVVCSMKVPSRLVNDANFLHAGAIAMLVDVLGSSVIYATGSPVTGVSVEINASFMDAAYVDEEIEIEAKNLRIGKAVGVVSVELRKKKTGKVIAQGRHSKYLRVTSKL